MSELRNLSFEEWLIHVFDHEEDSDWYFDINAEYWNGLKQPKTTVEYLTRLFENVDTLTQKYSDGQLKQGFWYIVSNGASDYMFVLMDETVAWEKRERCIRSIFTLYQKLFAVRCSPHLSHLDEPDANSLNLTCYMWWDLMPIIGKPDEKARRKLDEAIMDVMEATLTLTSDACRESALHGLGHWQMYYPERVGGDHRWIFSFVSSPSLPVKGVCDECKAGDMCSKFLFTTPS